MTATEILDELKQMGNESTKKIFLNHGAKEPFYGVKVGDMKKIQKKVKKNQALATELYDSGVSDAMYLAGLIAEEDKMTKTQIQDWAKKANWYMLSEYTVPWVAAESEWAWELAIEWIDAKEDKIASSGWATLSCILTLKKEDDLDVKELRKLLDRVVKTIHDAPNRVKYTMNGFVISLGGQIPSLTEVAKTAADDIGKVNVEMGGTACKVPPARVYIEKIESKGYVGKKKKTVKC